MGSLETVTSFSSGTGLGIETVSSGYLECGSELVALLFGDSVGAREFEGEDIKAGQYSAATTREQNEGTFVVARYGSYGDSEL